MARTRPQRGGDPLSRLFRELHRRDRLILPLNSDPLWMPMHNRRVHPGYLIFLATYLPNQ
ncbi:MAG: hypothetical protein CME13_10005 [Gemmatimonadetes bacterium]|jgi:hypothetical protein|nr:hypothetical protein [Gemmatimonadota bacterium]MBU08290.1 hypothetical protein [Gemmatimonadota bacterium]